MKQIKFLILLISMTFYIESIHSQDSVSFPIKLDAAGFRGVLAQSDNIFISGQPDADSFAKLKSEGVTTIVNIRTPPEMENRTYVPFDEESVVDSLGLKYIQIPLGGEDYPYTPEAVEKFADALSGTDGKVLLHCTTSHRASHLWAAYLIRYKGFEPNKAIEFAKAINFGDWPLEGLLGKKMLVEFK